MSRTRIPESVIIYGTEVPVIFEDELFNEKGEELDGDTDGKVIRISLKSKKSEHLDTLLHEMWHCACKRLGFVYRTDHDEDQEELESEAVTTIIRENFILKARR